MPLINFPAPGAATGQRLLEEFGGLGVTPTGDYKYTNLFTWSENLTKNSWTRTSDNQTITSDFNLLKDYIFDSEPVESSGVTINLAGEYNTSAGEAVYTTPGTYAWAAPANVNIISIVCIGGGGASVQKNGTTGTLGMNGGASYFATSGNANVVVAGGGFGGNLNAGGAGGTGSGFISGFIGGGDGGAGGTSGGGGGAGGYGGNGGNGGTVATSYFGIDGLGGAGGGGAGVPSVGPGYGGGGVGIYGLGDNGRGGFYTNAISTFGYGGGGGSGGTTGIRSNIAPYNNANGGLYGGGGGSSNANASGSTQPGGGGGGGLRYAVNYIVTPGQSYTVNVGAGGTGGFGGNGAPGAVRIIWGGQRSYPANANIVTPLLTEINYEVRFTNQSASLGQTVAVLPNTQYTLSFYARQGLASTANVYYRIYDNNNSSNIVARTDYLSQLTANARSRISVTFTTPSDCTSINAYIVDQPSGVPGSIKIIKPQLEVGSTATAYDPTNYVSFASLGFTANAGTSVSDSGSLGIYTDPNYDFTPVIFITGISTVKYQTASEFVFDQDLIVRTQTVSSTKILYFPIQESIPYSIGSNVKITNALTGISSTYTVEAATTKSITITTNDALNDSFIYISRTFSDVYDQNKIISDFSRRPFSHELATPRARYYIANYYGLPFRSQQSRVIETVDIFQTRSIVNLLRTDRIEPDNRLINPITDTRLKTTLLEKQSLPLREQLNQTRFLTHLQKPIERLLLTKESNLNLTFAEALKLTNNFVLNDSNIRQYEKLTQIFRLIELPSAIAQLRLTPLKAMAVLREISHYKITDIPDSTIKPFNSWFVKEVDKELLAFTKPPDKLFYYNIDDVRRQVLTLPRDRHKLRAIVGDSYQQPVGRIQRQIYNNNLETIFDLRRLPGNLVKRIVLNGETLEIEAIRRRVLRFESNSSSITLNNVTNLLRNFPKPTYSLAERLIFDLLKPLTRPAALSKLDDDAVTGLTTIAKLGRFAFANTAQATSSLQDSLFSKIIPLRQINILTTPVADVAASRVGKLGINIRAIPAFDESRLTVGKVKEQIRVAVVDDIGKLYPYTASKVVTKAAGTVEASLTASYASLRKFTNEGAVGPVIPVIGQSGATNNILQDYLFDTDLYSVTGGNSAPTQSITIRPTTRLESPAVYFNGYRDYVESNPTAMLAFGPNATIEMMIRPMAATPLQVITSFWSNSYHSDKIDIYLNSSLQVCIGRVLAFGDYLSPIASATEFDQLCRTLNSLSTSFITHLAIVVKNNIIDIFFNGQKQDLIGINSIFSLGGTAQLRIGYAGALLPVFLTTDTIITVPTVLSSRSHIPILAVDPYGLPIKYSSVDIPPGMSVDPNTGYIVRNVAATNSIEIITPTFTILASNGLTIASKKIRARIVPEIVAEYLIVGGGGGGGSDMGGGGGGGGFLVGNVALNTLGTHGITVGAGGTGAIAGTIVPRGSNGGFSAIVTDTEVFYQGISYSVHLDGDTDNILTSYDSGLNLTGDFTIELWFYAHTYGGMILNNGGGSGIAWASYEIVNNSDGINFAASSTNTGYDIGSETGATGRIGTITLNTWNHIAVTRTGNIYRGFVNGVQGYTQTLALTPFNSSPRGLAVGSNYSTTWGTASPVNTVNGYITNVRIVKGTALYTGNFVPPTQPLTAIENTSVLLCSTPSLTENRSNIAYTVTTNGNPVSSFFNPFIGTVANPLTAPFIVNRIRTNIVPTNTLINNRLYAVYTFASGTETFSVDQVGTDRVEVFMWGGGGAGGRPGGWSFGSSGGAGAAARGEITLKTTSSYTVVVGGGGIYTTFVGANGGGGIVSRNGSDNSYGGGGGGYSGLFQTNIDQATAILIAGGGGGGGSSRAGTGNQGGGGGGLLAQDGISAYDGLTAYRGRGGTQSAAGDDASSNGANTLGYQGALQGGSPRTNSYGGAGGGGYWGGSGGGYAEANTMGGGGGGSGYAAPNVLNAVLTGANFTTPGDSTNTLRGSAGNAGGVSTVGTGGVVILRFPIEPLYFVGGTSKVAVGGGAGATTHDRTNPGTKAGNGGSGGGASGNQTNWGYGIPKQGFNGGASAGAWYPGGGGGAGGAGLQNPATGGAGLYSDILGSGYWWSGGGGGGGYSTWGGNGGRGGGGGGAPRSSTSSTTDGFGDRNGINFAANATVGSLNSQTNVPGGSGGINTGGGGGGGAHYNVNNAGGNGGSGMVIVRYLGDQSFIGGNVTKLGGYTIHTFTTSGTLAGQVYTIVPVGNLIVESDTITYQVSTYQVASGTTLYWSLNAAGNITSSNFAGNVTSGSFTVGGDSLFCSGGFTIQTVEDTNFGGSKNLVVDLRIGSSTGTVVATADRVLVAESLPFPPENVIITTTKIVFNESEPLVFTVASNIAIANGTVVYWTLSGVTTSESDFNITSGSAVFNSNVATISVVPVVDSDTILESAVLQLRARSINSTVFKVSDLIYINSNSTGEITASATIIPEEGTVTFTLNTVNIPDGTNIYWENVGTSLAADFSDNRNNGNLTIINNSATLERTGVLDALADGDKTLIVRAQLINAAGSILAVSPTVTIVDNGIISAADFVMVGGGGGGGGAKSGSNNGGGGGAGGFVEVFSLNLSKNAIYSITVGTGGAGAPGGFNCTGAENGRDSVFTGLGVSYTAMGGGAGGGSCTVSGGASGGSGGGTNVYGGGSALQFATYGYGFGNNGAASNQFGPGQQYSNYGGGGGAGGAGVVGSSGGAGGPGRANPFGGAAGMYSVLAGGGGSGSASGPGGSGIGGAGGTSPGSGVNGTGSGGGGGNASNSSGGGRGGNGIFALRYASVTALAIGGNIFAEGGYIYHVFNSSGNLTTNTITGTVTSNLATVNEGQTVTFTVNTTGISNGSTLFWQNFGTTNGVTDFVEGSNSGSFTINNNTGSFAINLVNDFVTEGSETIIVAIRVLLAGSNICVSSPVTVVDTTTNASISITGNPTSVYEGDSLTYTITAPGAADGTVLYWTNNGTTAAADFVENVNSGSVVINSNVATFSLSPVIDANVEGNETVVINVRRGSITGTVICTSSSVTVINASYTVVPNTNSVTEGGAVTFTVTTANIQPGTYYWTNAGTTNASDFTSGLNSGNITVVGTVASATANITLTTASNSGDAVIETIILQLRSYSTSGPVLATSSTVDVLDPFYNLEYIVVAGGGGGGRDIGGGGGGGGFLSGTATLFRGQTYTISVGGGGSGSTSTSSRGSNGGDSSISGPGFGTTALGGGGGGSRKNSGGGATGGSGGGGAVYDLVAGATTAGAGTSGQGNSGAAGGGDSSNGYGGGGGGAGQAGQAYNDTSGSAGGNGNGNFSTWISQIFNGSSNPGPNVVVGKDGHFAGGGGGGGFTVSSRKTPGVGGLGGGATAISDGNNGPNGTAYTGGGGAGQSSSGAGQGGTGGSGVVILRSTSYIASVTGGGQAFYNGNYYYFVFLSGGTLVIN